jgi:hypothetical protein
MFVGVASLGFETERLDKLGYIFEKEGSENATETHKISYLTFKSMHL